MKRASQTVLILPGALADANLAEMPDGLSLQIGQSDDATFDMLDDHTGSLHAAGQLVFRSGRTLTLLEGPQAWWLKRPVGMIGSWPT